MCIRDSYDVNWHSSYETWPVGKGAPWVDNDGDGAIDEGIDENIDEMIDESRDDYIDNDGDWSLADDVGINGDQSGGIDAGVNDQAPTSGSGTGFPGEPNIDKTDVSESDQMGLTSVQKNDGGFNTSNDYSLWNFSIQIFYLYLFLVFQKLHQNFLIHLLHL